MSEAQADQIIAILERIADSLDQIVDTRLEEIDKELIAVRDTLGAIDLAVANIDANMPM